MYILSIDTSTKDLSIALVKDTKVIRSHNYRSMEFLEKSIVPMIDRALAYGNLALKDIDVLAVGLGPGSFTSLRVGLATIKAFAHYGGQKVVGVCSMDVIARNVVGSSCDEIAVIIDARRKMVYGGLYTPEGQLKGEYSLSPVGDFLKRVNGRTLFVGDGLRQYKDDIALAYNEYTYNHGRDCTALYANEHLWLPQASTLSQIAYERVGQGKTDDVMALTPIYLYPDDCQTAQVLKAT